MSDALRVAIVGAGPAGCLMAAALLDAARLRRRSVEIRLFGARPSWGPGRPLVLDDASVATLTSTGIPLPPGQRLGGILTVHGAQAADLPAGLRALPRDRLVALLRSAVHARGALLDERRVTGVAPLGDDRWVVRADGGSLPVDAVVLACGAGAPLATRVPGHRPPPAARVVAARLPSPPRPPPHLQRLPRGPDDLWLVPLRDGMAALLVGPTAHPRDLGLALLELGLGDPAALPGPPDHPSCHWVAEGWARPAIPCLGNALGGDPSGTSLSDTARQAARIASALLDRGMETALELCRDEVHQLRPAWRRQCRARARLRRFPERARERALAEAARRRRDRLPGTVQRALAGEPGLGLLQVLAAFLLLVWAWVRTAFAPRRSPPALRPGGEIFVVDDDPVQTEGLCAHLRQKGLRCRAYPDVLRAVQAAAASPPAAFVLDLALPWIDGLQALEVLRRSGLREIPVFIVSALPAPAAGAAHRPPVQAWFEKPLDLAEFGRSLALAASVRNLAPAGPALAPEPSGANRLADDR